MTNSFLAEFLALSVLFALCPVKSLAQNQRPVADAGLPRYAATDPVQLDGTGSYDPDSSGLLGYAWQQIAGPPAVITDADSGTPTISGFVQTSEIQECEFELIVSDSELISLPDTVKVIIVPDFGASTSRQENPPFDPDKPTVIYFGGGNCVTGLAGQAWNASAWNSRANVISFPNGYGPDSSGGARTYYKYGDMIIVYLSSVAPDYKQPIQTIGWSTGGMPAIDVGIHLNRVYRDARYAVNHVTHLDAPCRFLHYSWDVYLEAIGLFLTSSVAEERCWLDVYYGTEGFKPEYRKYLPWRTGNFLLVYLAIGHGPVRNWYRNSFTGEDMNKFNDGVVGGAYWSVIGPGKNLQLAPTDAYYFSWDGGEQSGRMSFYDEAQYPGRLPEPVTLVGPVDLGDPNGALLTCEESENAVGYELLVGSEPFRVIDYQVISDTPAPPKEPTRILAFEGIWWTVRVREEYGSTIYADPQHISPGLDMIDFGRNGKVDFKDFAILAQYWHQNEPSVDIAPAPIGDGKVDGKDVTVLAQYWLKEVLPVSLIAYWKLDETEGSVAHDSIGGKDGFGPPDLLWRPEDGKVGGALELDGVDDFLFTTFSLDPANGAFSIFAWIKGGGPGQVVVSQKGGVNWLSADPSAGNLMTELKEPGRFGRPLVSQTVVTDGDWHHLGLTWDGSNRILYVDDVDVAKDTQTTLAGSAGGLYFGAGKNLEAGSFFSGLIDDVKIYDRAVTP